MNHSIFPKLISRFNISINVHLTRFIEDRETFIFCIRWMFSNIVYPYEFGLHCPAI